jgi:electron transfer flavoprotein beta subunit
MAARLNVMVAVKRCVDYASKIRILPDHSVRARSLRRVPLGSLADRLVTGCTQGVDVKGAKHAMNPFCEIALEEALRLKERGVAAEVHAVSVGPAAAADVLRTALALGADRVTHVLHEGAEVQPLGVAHVLAALVRRESVRPSLVLLGKQAIDDDAGQTGQMLAALLDWPQAIAASRLECDSAAGTVDVTREGDAGLSTLRLRLPAVVTSDLRLNQPRYATLAATLRAKKASVTRVTPDELGADVAPRLELLRVEAPPKRPPGVRVADVHELLARLRERGAL